MNVSALLVIGITAMLVLAIGIIGFVMMYQRRVIYHQLEIKKINEKNQQELLQATIQSEEQERMRIASELHDDVAVTLASVKLFISRAGTNDSAEMISQSKELLNESIDKIRSISHSLQPATLQYLGLEKSLQSYVEMLQKSGSIKAAISVRGTIPALDDNVELNIYRIMQELTNNIIKHSAATAISIGMACEQDMLYVLLEHNGKGITQQQFDDMLYKKGATGLKNITNRLKYINGAISFYIEDNKYYTAVTVPAKPENKKS